MVDHPELPPVVLTRHHRCVDPLPARRGPAIRRTPAGAHGPAQAAFTILTGILAVILFCGSNVRGAELPDPAKLPPAATRQVDFTRDVTPILEANCLRCHGEEKTKSGFSLASRERALKGGDEGVDIVPGDSAASPLIYYVARLVEDMEMPPGNREPLTDEEVGILRAWIDQGARWAEQPAFTNQGSATPAIFWSGVDGDVRAFREFEAMHESWRGGLEEFSFLGRFESGSKVEIEGHALAPDDYRLNLTLSKPELGFIRAGAEEWRRYYDDIGGYNPLAIPSSYRLDEDLGLDIGRVWLDLGLTLPHAPTLVLGYEYQFRNGDKSTLQWGLADGRAIYPASKEIDESVQLLKFDFQYDFRDWRIEDNARVEWYRNQTIRNNTLRETPAPTTRMNIDEHGEHVRGANTFRVEKQVTDWWRFTAASFYSRLNGDSSYSQTTVVAGGPPAAGTTSQRIDLNTESYVFSVAGLLQPLRTLSTSVGVQYDHSEQTGFGPINLNVGLPANPFLLPVTVNSSLSRRRWSELVNARFTGIPFTVVFAEARLDQEDGSQFEEELGNLPAPLLLRDTDFSGNRGNWKVGLQISQWSFASLNLQYLGLFNNDDYNHLPVADPVSSQGYSAFIRERNINGDGFRATLALRPCRSLNARLKFEQNETQYFVNTDPVTFTGSPGGEINSGNTRGYQYEANVTFKPWRRLGLGASAGYLESETSTEANDIPSVSNYAGHSWWARGTAAFALSNRDDLFVSYEYWRSDFAQAQYVAGLPLGSDFSRHTLQLALTRRWSTKLKSAFRYGFYDYNDPASGGARNYTAHAVFATLSYQFR